MKNIYKYVLSIGVLFFSSCSDFLEVKPANELVVSSYDDVKALMGSHLKMFKDSNPNVLEQTVVPFHPDINYNEENHMFFHFYSDDFNSESYLNNWTGSNYQGFAEHCINWDNISRMEGFWKDLYSNIGFYNMILHQLDLFSSGNTEKDNWIKAEAKVLRAWDFFKLMQYYSPYHKNELGLPLNTDSEAIGTYDSARKTQAENYEFIINELKEVLGYSTSPSSSYNLFFNKNIINALLAQVYWYKGDSGAKSDDDYDNAIKYAKIALVDSNMSFAEFDRSPDKNDWRGSYTNKPYALYSLLEINSSAFSSIQGYPEYDFFQFPSDDLYALYSDTDKRKQRYFGTQKEIRKFESDNLSNFYKVDFFRAADLQLIIAESYARKGNDAEATKALNDFVKTRYTSYTQDSSKTLLQNILDERRREFCFEYDMRWIDLTRLQKGWSRKSINAKEKKTYTIEDNDFRFCFPIPIKSELSQNNKISQNPGW